MGNATLTAAIASELAALALEPITTPEPDAAAALGYGTDLSCVSDLAFDFGELQPQSVRGIAEALVHRLTTPRGGLLDDATYGLDLRQYLNTGIATPNGISDVSTAVRGECRKDDRVDDVTVTVDFTEATKLLDVRLTVLPVDVLLGAFSFTFTLDAAGIVSLGF
jgi:hypothetical protein